MKKLLIIVPLLLVYPILAQDLYVHDFDIHKNLLKVESFREDIILNDSVYGYDWSSSSWLLDSKDYLNYNENGELTERLVYGKNEQYEWQLERRFFYIYDEFGLWIELLRERINPYTLEYGNYRYHYHFFNENELLVKDTILEWDNIAEKWVNHWAGIFSYDNEEQLTNVNWNEWDTELEIWKQAYLDKYTYNTNLELIEYIYQIWDTTSNDWKNYSRRTYTYNENGNLISDLWCNWNNLETSWVNFRIYNNEYDEFDYLAETVIDIWLIDENRWVNSKKDIIINDDNGNIESKLSQVWSDYDSVWYNYEKRIYFNSPHQTTSNIAQPETSKIELYPNPTKNISYITNKTENEYYIELINVHGQIMLKGKVKGNNELIDLSDMNCGLYFVSFYLNGERQFTRKLLKK